MSVTVLYLLEQNFAQRLKTDSFHGGFCQIHLP